MDTKTDIPPSRLLDLTRSLRRTGQVATGIDRVELAYLDRFLADDVLVFGLVRTVLGYLLLDRVGLLEMREQLRGNVAAGAVDVLSRLSRGRSKDQQRAETNLRKLAVARGSPLRLSQMIKKCLNPGFHYYNVGHSNLTKRVLGAVKAAQGVVHVMIHDVIPLEHPELQRPGAVEPFRAMLKRAQIGADRLLFNSAETQRQAVTVMAQWGPVPSYVVAHLGCEPAVADASVLPRGLPPTRPYFMAVGTIEPRKNHGFLLDLWEALGPEAPPLLICGRRGWNNEAVFDRLDRLPADTSIVELNELSDPAIMALMENATGLLFPSLAEGYGYPPLEAAQVGLRSICNDLDVLREVLGDAGTFIPVKDGEKWLSMIKNWEKSAPNGKIGGIRPRQTWQDHFETVFRLE